MSHVFPRNMNADYPVAVAGDGCYIIDSDGKRYLDGSGGAAVSCLGHNHPAVIDAVRSQIGEIAFAHTGFFTSAPAEALASLLVEHAPAGINHVYFLETGRPERRRVIARRQSYHGNTLGALAAGGNAWRRQAFDPLLVETSHIAPCYAYREMPDGKEYGRQQRQKQARMKALEAGADNHDRPKEPDNGSGPSMYADTFAKKQRRQHCHHKRRDESHRHRIGKGHEIQPDDEQGRRPRRHHAPGNLQRPEAGLQDPAPMIGNENKHAQDKPDLAQPDDLQCRKMIGQIFRLCVDSGEDEHAGKHEQGAPDIVDGPFRRGIVTVRVVLIVGPVAIGRGTCHGRRRLTCLLASRHGGPLCRMLPARSWCLARPAPARRLPEALLQARRSGRR